ncbi:epoxide hydrolase family protein [Paenibacillus sp. 481]|uniref:epoxide hydrolase family protein n=1 Tax=Paenibacillus sp. 481 TaxID=2835869 RepID=UPI001E45AB23|nr:epoxide hydrolase family protein [Paenibacillus sp. 481]UHA75444.1 epoxide hydrolase [Paenibacillus sp. 481]
MIHSEQLFVHSVQSNTSQDAEINPFRIDIPQADLDDLHYRLSRTRWPDALSDVGWDYGVPIDYLKQLVEYWKSNYDWRKHEDLLNQFPQFTTTIDGQNIHFLHVRSPEPEAMPLIITHGWPGSIVEFINIIGPLTDPRAHGGKPENAFHIVAPSIPGFGFSGPTTEVGWNTGRVAQAWAELMRRLGYERYGVQGGDTGSIISLELGRIAPNHVIGVHANGLTAFPSGDPTEWIDLSDIEYERLEQLSDQGYEASGYAIIQATRPQTLSYGLTDSPVGQLAWIVEKFKEWTDPTAKLPEDAVDLDLLLTNVTLYWLTGTAGSSARIYKEGANAWGQPVHKSTVPTGVAVFPHDCSIRRLVEREHHVVHWSEFNRGGHFAAMEAPDLLVADIRKFFGQLR